MDAVKHTRATVLIGASAQAHAFTEDVVRAVASNAERPVIFALSNPTDKAECTAAEAYTWTDGRALFASGSPFAYHTMPDGTVRVPGQANNCYIFPGTSIGAGRSATVRMHARAYRGGKGVKQRGGSGCEPLQRSHWLP